MKAAPPGLELRRLTGDDAASIRGLAGRCPGAAQWNEAGYQVIGTNGVEGWGAFQGAELLGFIITSVVQDEMEILNLAVDVNARRRGVASRLLSEAEQDSSGIIRGRIYLEVRESNSVAQGFYSSRGFVTSGKRARYYSGPVEDALVLVRTAL